MYREWENTWGLGARPLELRKTPLCKVGYKLSSSLIYMLRMGSWSSNLFSLSFDDKEQNKESYAEVMPSHQWSNSPTFILSNSCMPKLTITRQYIDILVRCYSTYELSRRWGNIHNYILRYSDDKFTDMYQYATKSLYSPLKYCLFLNDCIKAGTHIELLHRSQLTWKENLKIYGFSYPIQPLMYIRV